MTPAIPNEFQNANSSIVPELLSFSVLVLAGQTVSEPFKAAGFTMIGVRTPAALTSTLMYFTNSLDAGASYQDCYDALGNRISAVVAANRFVKLDPATFDGIRVCQLVIGHG